MVDGNSAGQSEGLAVATLYQFLQKFCSVLAAGDASKLEVLPSQEYSGMERNQPQKARL
jgi:hypothetical protein